MATYSIPDLLVRLSEITNDGYDIVDIYELEAEDDLPAMLHFEAIDSNDFGIDYEPVESCDPDEIDYSETLQISPDDLCGSLLFTYNEIATLHLALKNAIEHGNEYIKKPECSKEEKAQIKSINIQNRNLEAKIHKFTKTHFGD